MPDKEKASQESTEAGELVEGPKIGKEELIQSESDFERHFKQLFEEMEAWRKESASSQTRVA